jgi:hypothetical protein
MFFVPKGIYIMNTHANNLISIRQPYTMVKPGFVLAGIDSNTGVSRDFFRN